MIFENEYQVRHMWPPLEKLSALKLLTKKNFVCNHQLDVCATPYLFSNEYYFLQCVSSASYILSRATDICNSVPDKRDEMLLTRPAHVHRHAGRRLRGVEARELGEDRAMRAHGDVGPLLGGLAVD